MNYRLKDDHSQIVRAVQWNVNLQSEVELTDLGVRDVEGVGLSDDVRVTLPNRTSTYIRPYWYLCLNDQGFYLKIPPEAFTNRFEQIH